MAEIPGVKLMGYRVDCEIYLSADDYEDAEQQVRSLAEELVLRSIRFTYPKCATVRCQGNDRHRTSRHFSRRPRIRTLSVPSRPSTVNLRR